MSHGKITLGDKLDLSKSHVLLNGTQALVRLMLMQKERDRRAGHNTAGYVTGYRGSPLGAVDLQMSRARAALNASDIHFEPGLNEDLAATAIWGSQQAELRGEGRFDGVFGLWYGKGPGVDRSGDVMRHANMAGTSPLGGVLMAMGDDHTGESSTVLHQSDWAMVDAYMPVLSPAGVQEILDLGLYGYEMSRFAGVWAGLKAVKDTVEATAVVNGDPHRLSFVRPEFDMPPGGLNIRLGATPHEQEALIIDYKRFAAEAFSHANGIDKRMHGRAGARIGLVAAGKNWLDLVHAMTLLGLDDESCDALGVTTYKVGQTFPLDMKGFNAWAEGLGLIIVIEEKRKLIEVQIKEAIFDNRKGRRVYGWYKGGAGGMPREELFPTRSAFGPDHIARKLGEILIEEGRYTDRVRAGLVRLGEAARADNAPEIAARLPYFCAGCPHNSSTRVPEGSRAYAGIGCHYMVQWMDRSTSGFTQMGGEGANWIGEAPFSKTDHVFQNLGDGTYNHSGILAIRAALAAGTNITYKILYNDAVAMTGGQTNEGGLSADRIAREVQAMGVEKIAVVYDSKEDVDPQAFRGMQVADRTELPRIQRQMRAVKGVSVILYIQTCAAEKRRRRKRGQFPDPDKRLFINTDICEGCGDCGIQSNCVALVPAPTDLGRKRAIDQSACNKDFACLDGFCPSFVSVTGGRLRKRAPRQLEIGTLPQPTLPRIDGTHNTIITGVGGTGVVTIGAILAQAAQIDGLGAGMMEMAGLAQKGGAVHIHLRIGQRPEDISAIRVALGEADTLIGGDLVVSAGAKTLGLTSGGRTSAVVNNHDIVTGEFTRDTEFQIPSEDLEIALRARLGDGVALFDASRLAEVVMGDSIYSNMMVLGAAWQRAGLPLSEAAITEAIRLNGAKVEENLRAFAVGRWAALNADDAAQLGAPAPQATPDLEQIVARRAAQLEAHTGPALAERYRRAVARIKPPQLQEAVAKGYHKLLAYKDEYEVARMHLESRARVTEAFEGDVRLAFHLAPSFLTGLDGHGRPKKRRFPQWLALPMFRVLARMKGLRGRRIDPFGWQAERRMERALIAEYESDLEILADADPAHLALCVELAALPLQIRGYGPVKAAQARAAAQRRGEILAALCGSAPDLVAAQ